MTAAPSRVFRRIFDLYLTYRFYRSFARVRVHHTLGPMQLDPGLPVLLVSNHCSWWDGFFLAKLQRQLAPEGSLFTVMLESELRKYSFFRRLGAIGLDPKNPATVARSFKLLKRIGQSGENSVFISYFPQGEIRPQLEFPLHFKSGVELLVRLMGPLQILPIALMIEPLKAAKPSAFIIVGGQIRVDAETNITSSALESLIENLLVYERPRVLQTYLARAQP